MKLEIKNATCSYGYNTIFNDISFAVHSGEVLCLLGPNGSGKTTLLKAILGLLKLKQGDIYLNGKNINRWAQQDKAKVIGYIPQNHNPLFPYKVIDIVLMGRTAHLDIFSSPTKTDFEIALEALFTLNISHLRDRVYTEISGGERQLVLIARALAQQPDILIMDEPTSNLDFGNQHMVLSSIKGLVKQGLAVIMSSHFPDHALLYANKVLILEKGNKYKFGKPDDILTENCIKNLYGINVKKISNILKNNSELKSFVPIPN
ncbi:MAG: manganese/iron transport system ATP-binding protein [Clostridia bacterium]|nr:manganese/iron transport system ATP-binding protein [Clostridia bacterium]